MMSRSLSMNASSVLKGCFAAVCLLISAQEAIAAEAEDVLERFYRDCNGGCLRRLPSWIVPENAFAGISSQDAEKSSNELQGRLAELFREKSDWNILTYCCRAVEHDNPNLAKKLSFMSERLKDSGIALLMELDPRYMRDAFLARYPDDYLRLRQFSVCRPDAEGVARFEVKQELMSDSGKRNPYSHWKEGRIVSVRAVKGLQMRPVSAMDVSVSKDVVTGVVRGLSSNEVLLAEVEWPLKQIDPSSPRLAAFSREMMLYYKKLGVPGVMRDEYGFQKPNTPAFKNRLAYWYSEHFARLYEKRSGGRSLADDLPLLALRIDTPQAHAAAIAYTMSIYDACVATETDFYDSVKDCFGADTYVAKHVTWHPPFSYEEFLHNGLSWWASKRDWSQSDEVNPVPVSTGMMKKFGTPLWLNEGYGKNPEHYVKTLWRYIACGGRMVYHGIFDWDMKNTSVGCYTNVDERTFHRNADLLNHDGMRAEQISRLLPLVSRAPIDCPVLHIFGHDRLVDWLDAGYRDWGEGVVHGLGGMGYYADAYPASEIQAGTFILDQDGIVRVGKQRYAACVLYHLSESEKQKWDNFTGAKRICTRIFVDPDVQSVAEYLASLDAVRQIPLAETGFWDRRENRLPLSDGEFRLTDGTVVRVKGGCPDYAGDPVSGMLQTGGKEVRYAARGLFAARVENGTMTGLCGGEVTRVEGPGISLATEEPVDIALVKIGNVWHGVWQTSDMDRKIPAELRSITPNWIKLRGIKGRAHKGGKHTWLAVTPEFRWNENPKKPYLKKAYDRRNAEVEACQGKTVDIVMLGDSLTWNWEVSAGRKRYAELTNRYSVLNLGIPGDRVEHLLWRCRSGQLDGYKAKFVTVLIGVNNIWRDSADDILEGIRLVCDEVDKRQPDARLVMLPVFPSGELPTCERRRKIVALNRLLRKEAARRGAYWMDFYEKLLQPDGTISKSMMHDFVHIGDDGYRIWLDAIYQLVKDPSGKWKKRQLYTESSGRRKAAECVRNRE